MSKPVVVSLGEVLWDVFPTESRFGGAPANFACHAAALGAQVTMVSAVGNDERGREAVEILSTLGVDTSLVQSVFDAPTGSVRVSLDVSGKPTFTIHEDSAWDQIRWTPQLEAQVSRADWLYFGTLGQRGRESRETIRRVLDSAASIGVRRVLDVNLRTPFYEAELIRESVQRASVLKLSDEELALVANACLSEREKCLAEREDAEREDTAEELLRGLLEQYPLELVVMTRGEHGALLISPEETVDQPGIPTSVRDTVGAGDAFTAALVTGLSRHGALAAIASTACKIAASVCTQPGAVPR